MKRLEGIIPPMITPLLDRDTLELNFFRVDYYA